MTPHPKKAIFASALSLASALAGAQVIAPATVAPQVVANPQSVEIAGHCDNGVGTSDSRACPSTCPPTPTGRTTPT